MKKLFKIFGALTLLVAATLVAGVVVLSTIDFNTYKGVVSDQVEAATGRNLTIAGDLKLDVSFSPSLVVEGVSFANAPWGSETRMMSFKRLEAEVSLLPLLQQQVDIKRLHLVGVELLLETDAEGRGNWEFSSPATPSTDAPSATAPAPESGQQAAAGPGVLPVVRDVRAEDVQVTYRDGQSRAVTQFKLASLDLGAEATDAPLKLKAGGAFNGQEFEIEGTAGSVEKLLRAADLPLDIKAAVLSSEVSVAGQIGNLKTLEGLNLDVALRVPSVAATLASARALSPALGSLPAPEAGELRVSLKATGSLAKLSLASVQATLEKAGVLDILATGQVADVIAVSGIDIALDAKVTSPKAAAALFEAEAPDLPALSLAGKVADVKNGYAVEGLDVRFGESRIMGSLGARLGGDRPRVAATLKAPLIDLDALQPPTSEPSTSEPPTSEPAVGEAGQEAAKDSSGEEPGPGADGRLFPDAPLPFDLLGLADAVIRLNADEVRAGGQRLTRVNANISLNDRRLRVKPVAADISGGRVTLGVIVDGRETLPEADVRLRVTQLDYGALLTQLGDVALARGHADVEIDVKGQGTSVRQIMAGLNGKVRLKTQDGRLDNGVFDVLSTDILSALPLVDDSGNTALRCAVANFDVEDGLASVRALVGETGGLSVVGVGGVNLRDETLNLAFEPRAKQTSLLSAALLPVVVRGTLAQPSPEINPADLAEKVAGDVARGAAAVATFGLSILAEEVIGRAREGVDGTDYCRPALAGRKVTPSSAGASESESSLPSVPSAVEDAGEAIQGLGKKLDEGLRGLFGR